MRTSRTRRRRRRREPSRLIVRQSREVHSQTRIVLGIVAAFLLLILLGFNIQALIVIAALAAFVALVFLLVRGPTPLYEIVADEDLDTRAEKSPQLKEDQFFTIPDSFPDIHKEPSNNLQKALGPLATELHDLEMELLEQAANGRLPAKDVARLAQELAKNRTELIGEETPAADGPATGQPDPGQTER